LFRNPSRTCRDSGGGCSDGIDFLAVMKMFDDKKIGFFSRSMESGYGGLLSAMRQRLSSAIAVRQQRLGE
jgi:hypothetical protein